MRDQTHEEFIVRWANYVRDNPDRWRKQHTKFINSQINMNKQFLKRLLSQKDGKRKIIELYELKNRSNRL